MNLTARDAWQALRAGAVLVDVREPWEWQAGHAPDATHLPEGRLPTDHRLLPRGRRLLVICRSGNRSVDAARTLRRLGYEAFNVLGGLQAWTAAGLPVTADSASRPKVA